MLKLYTALTNTSKIRIHLAPFFNRGTSTISFFGDLLYYYCMHLSEEELSCSILFMQLHTEEIDDSFDSFACRYYAEVK